MCSAQLWGWVQIICRVIGKGPQERYSLHFRRESSSAGWHQEHWRLLQLWQDTGLGHGWLERSEDGFGGLTASSMVRGVTDPSSRRRSRKKDAMMKQGGVWMVSPLEISSRTPRLVGGKPNWGRESMKLKKKHCFMTSTSTRTPPTSCNYWESRCSVLWSSYISESKNQVFGNKDYNCHCLWNDH